MYDQVENPKQELMIDLEARVIQVLEQWSASLRAVAEDALESALNQL